MFRLDFMIADSRVEYSSVSIVLMLLKEKV